jgi:hypothetical protein
MRRKPFREVAVMTNVYNIECGLRGKALKHPAPDVRRDTPHEDYSFWPEVEAGLWVAEGRAEESENSAGRVLFEMALIFGAVGALVLAIALFAPPA